MLMAHPVVLGDLLDQYETMRVLHAERGTQEAQQRLEDVTYTLCVSTGTRDIDAALLAARRQLAGSPSAYLDDCGPTGERAAAEGTLPPV